MRDKVIIIGAGENGEAAENIFRLRTEYAFSGFLDDSKTGKGVLGPISTFGSYIQDHLFFVSIGNNSIRKGIYTALKESGARFASALHPEAYVEHGSTIGENCMLGAFAYVNTKCCVGENTIINTGCIVEHHNTIGKHCHLAPGVITAGGVLIEDGVFIGIGSTVRDHITIGEDGFFGAASNVVADTGARSKYYGNPARLVG